jgi:hypothetical protein
MMVAFYLEFSRYCSANKKAGKLACKQTAGSYGWLGRAVDATGDRLRHYAIATRAPGT